MRSTFLDGATAHRLSRALATSLAAVLACAFIGTDAWAQGVFQPVPEGHAPQGILAASRPARSVTLDTHPAGDDAVGALVSFTSRHWADLAAVDFVKLSRYHVEATRGW
ncbi:MAG: hypothetical protein AAFX85_07415, partial [Pseudomonadota bacterium]